MLFCNADIKTSSDCNDRPVSLLSPGIDSSHGSLCFLEFTQGEEFVNHDECVYRDQEMDGGKHILFG